MYFCINQYLYIQYPLLNIKDRLCDVNPSATSFWRGTFKSKSLQYVKCKTRLITELETSFINTPSVRNHCIKLDSPCARNNMQLIVIWSFLVVVVFLFCLCFLFVCLLVCFLVFVFVLFFVFVFFRLKDARSGQRVRLRQQLVKRKYSKDVKQLRF